ncbi:hypothetical protein Tco_0733513 [Tanacetum coccineum]
MTSAVHQINSCDLHEPCRGCLQIFVVREFLLLINRRTDPDASSHVEACIAQSTASVTTSSTTTLTLWLLLRFSRADNLDAYETEDSMIVSVMLCGGYDGGISNVDVVTVGVVVVVVIAVVVIVDVVTVGNAVVMMVAARVVDGKGE